MALKVYIAGPYSSRLELKALAEELVAESGGAIEVTSTWLDGEHEAKEGVGTLSDRASWGATDLDDIDRANLLVQFIDKPSTKGGAHCEFMYAIKVGKDVILVGQESMLNVFHAYEIEHGGQALWYETWDEASAWLYYHTIGKSAA